MTLPLLLSWTGFFILLWRLYPRKSEITSSWSLQEIKIPFNFPTISIIVPARNEEENLPRVLQSLKDLRYPHVEIIVVDDQSTDQTAEIAIQAGVTLVRAKPPPLHWNGKNWACHQGVAVSTGDYLLFTDADTEHLPDSLPKALSFFQSAQADLMSALPFHRAEKWWERWLSPFYALLFVATAINQPKHKRLFAIGQYLLFSRSSYNKLGGHKQVYSQYPDDLSLANHCLKSGGTYIVYTPGPLFRVRMYRSFLNFIDGYRRNFLAGIRQSKGLASLEVFFVICALTGSGRLFSTWVYFPPLIGSLSLIYWRQKHWGEFSFLSVLFFPFSIAIFCGITLLSLLDRMRGNVLHWKAREYADWL